MAKLIPDARHLDLIRQAVVKVHKATIFATELLNLHIRRLLEEDINADLKDCFSANWVLNAYNEVTYSGRKVKVVSELQETKRQCMPPFDPPDRSGVQQCIGGKIVLVNTTCIDVSTDEFVAFLRLVLIEFKTLSEDSTLPV